MTRGENNYFHLNLENNWRGAASLLLDGVVKRSDGTLTLASVPTSDAVIAQINGALDGAAGIGVDADGNVYIADPAGNQILRWDGCDGRVEPLACLSAAGSLPGQLLRPRGVLAGPRGALYIADSGNHRIQVVDLRALQVVAIWGQDDPYGEPTSSDAPGYFNDPWDLAADSEAFLYVVDHGNRRVQKFNADGQVIPQFWETMKSTQPLADAFTPAYITTLLVVEGKERLLVLDQEHARLFVYETDGTYDDAATQRWKDVIPQLAAGVVFVDGTLYVGDVGAQRVLAFDLEGHFLGEARAYRGAVTGLSLDRQGRLLVQSASGEVVRLQPGLAYREFGTLLMGPLSIDRAKPRWHRIEATGGFESDAAHLRFFTMTTDQNYDGAAVPPPSWSAPTNRSPDPTLPDIWRVAPRDQLDLLVLNEPARYLWIGAALQGDGDVSPLLSQIRVEYEHDGWLRYLPSIYRDDQSDAFLKHALSLFESLLGGSERLIDDLPLLFNARATAVLGAPESWLDWLATWLDFEIDQTWNEAQRRDALAQAFALYGTQGTAEGLEGLIRLYTGVQVRISETAAVPWSLGMGTALGAGLTLNFGDINGAILNTTATLDESNLAEAGETVAPLFERLAFHFDVEIYAADIPDRTVLEKVRRVIERGKPAHTTYDLRVIEPQMRVGYQARLGMDTIVAGQPSSTPLGSTASNLILSDDGRENGGLLGKDTRLDHRTTLA